MRLPPELNYLRPLAIDDLVRVGRLKDGGYVLPARLVSDADCLITFGVSTDWSFEKHFRRLNSGAKVISYDHTIGSGIFFRQALRDTKEILSGLSGAKYVAWRWKVFADYLTSSRVMTHHPRKIVDVRRSPVDASIDDVFNDASPCRSALVKIDIEGSEYEVIEHLMRYESRIVGFLVEFHDVATRRREFEAAVRAFQRGFDIVHIHGNNWCGTSPDGLPDALELTLVSKACYPLSAPGRTAFPLSALDYPCKPGELDLTFEFEAVPR